MNFLISFPRSGQHLTECILGYLCDTHGIKYSYCEYYSCCQSIPCKKESLFQKNHDFGIENGKEIVKINNESKYLVLFRKDPILQLESYYRYILSNSNSNSEKYISEVSSYEYDDLLKFVKSKLPYYNKFLEKWINNDKDNILKVEYYELVNNVEDTSQRIFNHFYPEVKIEQSKLDEISNIEFYTFSKKRNLGKVKIKNTINPNIYESLKRDLKL